MRRRLLACVLVAASASAACSAPENAVDLARGEEAIINGSQDTTHQAVVAILSAGGECSGTIVQVVGTTGYALTAAHCCDMPPQVVLQGNDYNANPIQYPVTAYEVHPLYDGSFYDFAVVQFTGAGAATPTIAPMIAAEDTLVAGNVVDLVGFGQTESGNNSVRRHVTRPIDNETPLLLSYNQATAGICFGDSGGPAISTVAGSDRVAGVSAYVTDSSCTDFGVSGRVSAVAESFVLPYIAGQPIGMQTCDQCFEASTNGVGPCVSKVQDCFNDPDCNALLTCLDACSTMACQQTCADDHAYGTQVYFDIYECTCQTACTAECQGDPTCPAPSACGFTSKNALCKTCFETSCCAPASACAADDFCSACFAKQPPAGCDQNALANAFEDCLVASCASQCNIGSGSGGGGAGGTGSGSPTSSGAAGGGGETATGGGATVASGAGGSSTTGDGSTGGPKSKAIGDSGDEGGCSASSRPAPGGALALWILALAASLRLRAPRRPCSPRASRGGGRGRAGRRPRRRR